MFDHIIGNQNAKAYLKLCFERETVANSMLFAGPEGIGKSLFAEAFAKQLICGHDKNSRHQYKVDASSHPDIRIYRPEGKIGMHTIAAMRQFNEEVYLAPYEADCKVLIIQEAERMLSYSANALLKTFEEPSPATYIILLSSSPATLLPTIVSRCRAIYFRSLMENEVASYIEQQYETTAAEAQSIASLAQGSISNALRIMHKTDGQLRKIVLDLLTSGGMPTYKHLSEVVSTIVECIESKKKDIEEVRSAMIHQKGHDSSAAQKQSMEKEVDGVVAVYAFQETQVLFHTILAWYRDLQLLRVKGKDCHLIHRDCLNQYEYAFERGNHLTIEYVQKAIREAQIALERSTSLHICFENLFLKLHLLLYQP